MADVSTSDRLALVEEWLQQLFKDQPVPPFEKNKQFIDRLYDLMVSERRSVEDHKIYITYLKQCAEEYKVDTQNTLAILNKLGLKPEVLKDNMQAQLANMADLAMTLKLGSIDDTNYILGLTDLATNKEVTCIEHQKEANAVTQYNEEIKQVLLVIKKLEAVINQCHLASTSEDAKADARSQETAFLKQKVIKYQTDIADFERQLDSSGMLPELSHKSILAAYDKLLSLQKKLTARKEELEMYQSLPPDKDLAWVKLEVARSELRDIEDELTKRIDMSHL